MSEALRVAISCVDDPLILATIKFLASDADPLRDATDELMVWSVTVREALSGDIDSLNAKYEPLKAATDELII